MPPRDRINSRRPAFSGAPFGRRFAGLLPWMFVVSVVLAIVLTFRHGTNWPVRHEGEGRAQDAVEHVRRDSPRRKTRHFGGAS